MSGFEIALIILAGGYVAGGAYDRIRKALVQRSKARERALAGPEPVCGCGHHLAYHDARDGLCYASVKPRGDSLEKTDGQERRCSCRRYAGPEPLATLYAPELTTSAHEDPDAGRAGELPSAR
ncbi:hypothetical protein OG361_38930 [Streptomyces sp. NBC_00090]|uniref:hypothetical protein n=1 Tax=Streptomyces sp. NBC_00090 TaxID=2903619 RepID=UPI0032485752